MPRSGALCKEPTVPDSIVETLVANWFIALPVVLGLLFVALGLRLVPSNKIGIVEKRISGSGSVKSGLPAMHGEAGFQPR
jgi:hypothetical protein